MVKSKFSSLDVRAMVNSVRPSVVGCKLVNIYDINSRVYMLKLQRSGFRCFLLLESGVRFHLTEYTRDKSLIPSNYTMKLRKHIRTRRLTSIEQMGADRRVDLTFGYGEHAFHLILELFVSGNLILTDHEYTILALLRTHQDQEAQVSLRKVYPLDSVQGLLARPLEEFPEAIEELLDLAGARAENQEIQEIQLEDEKGKSAFAKRSKKRVQHSDAPGAASAQAGPFRRSWALCCCADRSGQGRGASVRERLQADGGQHRARALVPLHAAGS